MVMLASAAARNERASVMFFSGQNKLALQDDPGLREHPRLKVSKPAVNKLYT